MSFVPNGDTNSTRSFGDLMNIVVSANLTNETQQTTPIHTSFSIRVRYSLNGDKNTGNGDTHNVPSVEGATGIFLNQVKNE